MNAWVVALYILVAVLLVITRVIKTTYGPDDFQSLTIAVLPIVFAAGGAMLVAAPAMGATETAGVKAAANWNGVTSSTALISYSPLTPSK